MIKHPLVQKEWKNTRWIMLLFLAIYAFFTVVLNNNMYDAKTSHLLGEYNDTVFMSHVYGMSNLMLPVVLVGIMVLSILLFANDRNIYVSKFISSLPFTRKEQFLIKYMIGIPTYTLPLLLFGVGAYAIRISHETWISRIYKYLPHGDVLTKQDSIRALILWLGIAWLIITAVYSFLMMIQTLMGQNIIAGVVGGIILFVPWFLMFAIPGNLSLLFSSHKITYPNWIGEALEFFFLAKPQLSYEPMETIQRINETWPWYSINQYQYLPLCIATLIAIIIISTILAHRFIQHNDVEKNGDIVMYPWGGKILVLGVSGCSLLLLPIIVVIFTQIESSIITLISMAIGGTLGYIISTKSIELTKRHE